MNYIGYPCMNRTLREESSPIRCNRDMQKATFKDKGLPYVSELIEQNLTDLKTILKWNINHDIYFYRCTSNLIPWHSQYELSDLPQYEHLTTLATEIGDYIKTHNIRFTFHPSHWVKLASKTESTVQSSIQSLENHGKWLDWFGLDRTPFYTINIHIGAHYNDKDATAKRFRDHFKKLSPAVQKRLTVENDDKQSLWGVSELITEVAEPLNIPITFDYHHHQFTDRGQTYKEAFNAAATTWPHDIEPIVHYSEPARLHTHSNKKPQAHADTITTIPEWLKQNAAVMVEAGAKEKAILQTV